MTTQLPTPSIGRYAPADPGSARRPVELRGLPVHVLLAAREHHDALLRELRLLALQRREGRALPEELGPLVDELGERWASPAPRADEAFDRAVADGVLVLDTVEQVPLSAAEALLRLEELLALADRLAARDLLMTVPRPPVLREFGRWYVREFTRQLLGGVPEPWDGPLQP
jgi:hypothetical protein